MNLIYTFYSMYSFNHTLKHILPRMPEARRSRRTSLPRASGVYGPIGTEGHLPY